MREAQASVAELKILMHDILQNNQKMMQAMAVMKPATSRWSWSTTAPSLGGEICGNCRVPEANSIMPSNESGPTMASSQLTDGNNVDIVPIKGSTNTDQTSEQDQTEDSASIITVKPTDVEYEGQAENTPPVFKFTFDEDLNSSRPYARIMGRSAPWTPTSSAIHTLGWSYLSGTSLADVSQISVLGLPVTTQELWNGEHYVIAQATRTTHVANIEESIMATRYQKNLHRPSKRSSAPTLSLLSPITLFNSQIQNLRHRRSLRNGSYGRQIGTELILIGSNHDYSIEDT